MWVGLVGRLEQNKTDLPQQEIAFCQKADCFLTLSATLANPGSIADCLWTCTGTSAFLGLQPANPPSRLGLASLKNYVSQFLIKISYTHICMYTFHQFYFPGTLTNTQPCLCDSMLHCLLEFRGAVRFQRSRRLGKAVKVSYTGLTLMIYLCFTVFSKGERDASKKKNPYSSSIRRSCYYSSAGRQNINQEGLLFPQLSVLVVRWNCLGQDTLNTHLAWPGQMACDRAKQIISTFIRTTGDDKLPFSQE